MDKRFNEHTGAKHEQPSGLPLSEAGAGEAAAAVEEVAAKIQDNAALTMADMQNFTDKLETAEVEVGSRRFSVEQLRSDPELRRNVRLWNEILSGEYDRHEELTLLTPAVAAALAGFKGFNLFLNSLTSLDPDTATALALFEGDSLLLNGLTVLEPETAAALAGFEGFTIYLNGLTVLEPETAAAVAGFGATDLYLDGLTVLELETAAALAGFGGVELSFYGLTSLDSDTAAALARFEGSISCQPNVKAQIDQYKSLFMKPLSSL